MPILDGRPLPSTYCPFCANDSQSHVVDMHDTGDAFALGNLFPAGIISVTVHVHDSGGSPCPRACNSREWRSLPTCKVSTHPEDTLFRQLAFLIQHLFLRATCKFGVTGRVVFIRMYLIPNDLPNVYGRLHNRSAMVLREARRYLHNIVPLIEQNGGLWDADEACLNAPQKHFFPHHIDNRTMAEIYTDLPSPILSPLTNENTRFSHHIASGGTVWGLRTALYSYQRHSVAVMLDRESSTSPVPDPLCIAVSCMSGVHCYVQPSTMSILRECPMFSPCQAGILCEELGTGKTIMVISLILATANQLPDPEESVVDERPVLTPLAYNHFPSAEFALARNRAGSSLNIVRQVPSLVELLVHHFSSLKTRTSAGRPAFADELEACHLWPFIQANTPFYHHYDAELAIEVFKKSRRQNPPNLFPRTMYLSSATLVVVPLALLGQWKTELDKHCHDYVRYLIVRPSMDLPDARKLASSYELIVMSDARFRIESKRNMTEKLCALAPCSCSYLPGSRVPDCHCPGYPGVTPLLQIRWKRLVIDEGHNASEMTATINYFVRQLSIQHKWIVTGTPTSNILGLQLGRATDEHELDHRDSVESVTNYSQSGSPVPMSPDQDDRPHVRIWGSYDRLNLRKLGIMIGDFLSVPQFMSRYDPGYFTNHVTTPLCNRHGPRPGAVKVLTQVMQTVMVRHSIEDVEKDVLLPPMKHDTIYMDLDSYALKSYNAMQASLVINAIDSEREGPDYLFHPSKSNALQAAINNSSQGLFWSSSDILYNVDEISNYADKYLDNAIRRKIDSEELDLLQQAFRHAAAAANDETWRAMQLYADVPFKISGLDSYVFEAWTRTGLRSGSRTVDVIHPDRLVNLRSLVRERPLISVDGLIKEGNNLDSTEKRTMAPKTNSKQSHVPVAKHDTTQTKEIERAVKETIKVLRQHIERMDVSDGEEIEGRQDEGRVHHVTFTQEVAGSSPLSGVRVGPSLSTKLNYILSEVQRYSVKEKFLIFSASPLTLFQIGEALSLFEIKYLRYTRQEEYLLREQCIMTFETSDVYRILLVDLKLGARGLNLISASRIIFCEPIWHPDVESQAIKRVHRIGQTKPVTVKTLAIRSTAEEAMISRRKYLSSGDKVPSMTTESGMRHYLQNPRFLSDSVATGLASVAVVLSLDDNRAVDMKPSSSGKGGRVDTDTDVLVCESDGDVPVRKRVRFEG